MDLSPFAQAMSSEGIKPSKNEEDIPKPLGDEVMGDGEKMDSEKPQPEEEDLKGDEGMGDGGKMDSEGAPSKTNMPESSTTSDGRNPSMGSVFDEQVGQISKEVMKQNIEEWF